MLIALTGKMGSGKDTAGERLALMADQPAIRISFAAKLKQSAAALFDIDPAEWEWAKNDDNVLVKLEQHILVRGVHEVRQVAWPLTVRELLQRYGTESHRDIFGFDFWVKQALVDYDTGKFPRSLFYVTDCRFENEAQAVKERGGKIYRVIGANESTGSHASEVGLPDALIDAEIDNTKRNDDYFSLDLQLAQLAQELSIPLKTEAWA